MIAIECRLNDSQKTIGSGDNLVVFFAPPERREGVVGPQRHAG